MMAQSAIYTTASALQLFGAALVIPLLTRFFSAEEFGLVVSMLLVTQVFAFFTALGLPVAVGREYHARDQGPERSRALLGAMVPISVVVAAIVVVSGPLWIKAFATTSFGWVAVLAGVTTAPRAVSLGAQSLFRASGRPVAFAATGVATGLGTQGAGLLAATLTDGSIQAFFGGYLAMQTLTALGALFWAKPQFTMRVVETVRPVMGYALPAIVHAGAGVLIVSGDRVIVERTLGLESVGQYQVLYLLAVLGLMGTTALNQAWGPQILRRHASKRWDALVRSSGPFMRIAGFLAAGCALFAPLLLPIASPYDLRDDVIVTAIASVAAVGWAHYVSCSQVLFIERQTTALMVISPSAAALNIGLNLILVPMFALRGAALATVAAYAFWGLAAQASADRRTSLSWPARDRIGPYAVAIGGAASTIALPSSALGHLGRGLLIAVCAAGALQALLQFSDEVSADDGDSSVNDDSPVDHDAGEALLPSA